MLRYEKVTQNCPETWLKVKKDCMFTKPTTETNNTSNMEVSDSGRMSRKPLSHC